MAQNTSAELRQYANFGPAVRDGMADISKAGSPQGLAAIDAGLKQYTDGINAADAGISAMQAALQANPNNET